jgi:ADP-heptose:LPS heptosyltransferase
VGIGDELMVTGVVRELQSKDPRRVRIQYEKLKRRWCDLWDNNPRIARHEEDGNFQILEPRFNYLRPYCSLKTATQWTWKPYRPPKGEIYFTSWELGFGELNANRIIIGPTLKSGASPNKQWGDENWKQLIRLLIDKGRVTQIGLLRPKVFPGVDFIQTSIRQAAAMIARAKVVICNEGALHHIAAAVGTPCVTIFGGYISPQVTGYDDQVSFFVGDDLGCGMRIPCNHCSAAMAEINPEQVAEAAIRVMR